MAKLHDALAWAARGYRVFPLAENSRRPAFPDWDWSANASTDPATLAAWWGTGDWNVGCCTGAGTVVVDLDVKHRDKGVDGIASYMALAGDMDTLVVRTTTGGLHLYFTGEGRNRQGATIAQGIDARGDGGYVVAPGSTIDGVAYQVIRDAPLAPLPAEISERIQPRATIATSTPVTELDTPSALAWARAWLASEPPAIEGQGGDGHTYRVACDLRDRGVSEHVALDMLLADWNERCVPPWDATELQAKVRNAYAYAQNSAGAKAPEVLLGTASAAITMVPEDPGNAEVAQTEHPGVGHNGGPPLRDMSAFKLGSITPLAELAPRPWLVRRFLMRGEITAIVAPGGAGKSQMQITVAIFLALGIDVFGMDAVPIGVPQNSIVYDAEDRLAEMSRRLYATCHEYGIDPARVMPHIALVSGKEKGCRLKFARMGERGPEVVAEDVTALLSMAHFQNVAMVAIGPLVKLQQGLNENDNSAMDVLMEAIGEIGTLSNAAILLTHHLAKPGLAGSAGYVGNADAARGAGNIISSCRIAFTLAAPTVDDMSRLNLTPKQARRLLRLDDAKMNLTLLGDEPLWIEKRTVRLHTGDEVGAFVLADMTGHSAASRERLGQAILAEMTGRAVASLPLAELSAVLQDLDPIYSKLTRSVVRARIERFFMDDVTIATGQVLHLTAGEKRMVVLR